MRSIIAIGLLVALAVTNVLGGFFIAFPSTITWGTPFEIAVDVFNTTEPVNVEACLQTKYWNQTTRRSEVKTHRTINGVFNPGKTGLLTIDAEERIPGRYCQVHVIGTGGLQFERETQVYFQDKVVSVLIQTDKAIYKPGQIVRYRALAVYPDLQVYQGTFHVEISDPSYNKIKIERDLKDDNGVIEGSLQLSDQPPFGEWRITVALDELADSSSQAFTVEDYKLPRFEIKVDLPSFMLLSAGELTGTVDAKYTFGQPVKGRVELRVGPDSGLDSCGKLPRAVEMAFDIDGKADFRVPVSDLRRVVRINNNARVRVYAFVKETTTGVRLNGSSSVTFYEKEHTIKFLENTPSVFKPGLPFTAFVQVHTPDNMPPVGEDIGQVAVYAYATYKVTPRDMRMYQINEFTGSFPLPGYSVPLPANGVLPIRLDIPNNATSINIAVHYNGQSASKSVLKPYSKSGNFIQLSLQSKNLKPQDTADVLLRGTEPLNSITYVLMSRGSILSTNTIDGEGQVELEFEVPVTASMAPTAQLIAYYNRGLDEIVADSMAFNVDGIFENEVSVEFSTEKAQPGDDVEVVVTADADSHVNLLAVDQSVLLLKTGNDITPQKVEDAVSQFDKGKKPSDSEFALSYSSRNTDGVFRETGLTVITDVKLTGSRPRMTAYGRGSPYGGGDFAFDADMEDGLMGSLPMPLLPTQSSTNSKAKVEKIRKLFPEAWLWQKSVVGDDGRAVIQTKVPDTITSWIASAFATNLQTGLGVAPVTAKLTVFKPFFVSLNYPSSVKRHEIAIIQATVFNYLDREATVVVSLGNSPNFEKVTSGLDHNIDEEGQSVVVPSNEQGVVYFPIRATQIGLADVIVRAQSRLAADAVNRKIDIQAEGAPVRFNYPLYVHLDGKTKSFRKVINFRMPSSAIKDSSKARVKVSGDLIGPSLHNIESLLSLPTGCGEQSMVKFAPNLYIARYLTATGQMTEHLEDKIVRMLSSGYQRQLSYRRYDGSFSAFGSYDESGSTWLTAFVTRTLNEARDMIYVDPQMLHRALTWLLGRQTSSGAFAEFGRVLDPITQEKSGPGLTAYVLQALVQTRNIAPMVPCEPNATSCHQTGMAYKLSNATAKAMKYLESQVDTINTPLTLALVSLALNDAESEMADDAFNKLMEMAKSDGPLQYWADKSKTSKKESDAFSLFKKWRPPVVQGRPIDILATSYALLNYVAYDRLDEGMDALKWLVKQRNSYGGFVSTQDTVVALQALASVAAKTGHPDNKAKVVVIGDKKRLKFKVSNKNALELQIQEFEKVPRRVDVRMSGKGAVVSEVDFSFNTREELSVPGFDVSTVLLDDDLDSFNLMICTKWLMDRKTGMVVQEIGIPSGFKPDLSTLGNVVGMKRSERTGNVVAIYFDEIGTTSTCYSLLMTRISKVAQSQPSYVRTYDYYQPDQQSTVFYLPRKLKNSKISDVCPRC